MNRNVASLLFLATAVFFAGCSNHPDSFGEAGSSGSSGTSNSTGSAGSAGSTGSTDGSSTTAVAETDDLATFARAGIADPEYVDARLVNDVSFVSDENPDAFNDLF
jgi:hypothetical protein